MSKRKRLPSEAELAREDRRRERAALQRGRDEAKRVMEEERAREPLLVERDALMAARAALRDRMERWAAEHALSIARLLATALTCTCGKDCFVCQAKVMYEEDRSLLDRYLAPGADAVIAAERRFQDAVSRALGQPLLHQEDA